MSSERKTSLPDKKRKILENCSSDPDSIASALQSIKRVNAEALEKAGHGSLLSTDSDTIKNPQYSLDE